MHSTASASSAMHLLVKNSEDATNYHLTPLMKEIDDINEEITAELDAMLPYLNFFVSFFFAPHCILLWEPRLKKCLKSRFPLPNLYVGYIGERSVVPHFPPIYEGIA